MPGKRSRRWPGFWEENRRVVRRAFSLLQRLPCKATFFPVFIFPGICFHYLTGTHSRGNT